MLHYNLDRYPNGIFFLYFGGRLHSTETQLEDAVVSFHKAIQAQREYIQLGHICYWDLGLVSLAMGNYVKGYECFNILDKESNWSKAIYAYAKATTLYEEGRDVSRANSIMANVPDLMQRIAGKSIPLEVRLLSPLPPSTSRADGLMASEIRRSSRSQVHNPGQPSHAPRNRARLRPQLPWTLAPFRPVRRPPRSGFECTC